VVGSIDRQTQGTRWICISAAKFPPASVGISAEETLRRIASAMVSAIRIGSSLEREKGQTSLVLNGNSTEVVFGGRRMERLDMTEQVNNMPTRWSQLLTIERGYGLMFMFSDPVRDESGMEAAQAIKSLHFLGKTN
jgi:hypothetical protein